MTSISRYESEESESAPDEGRHWIGAARRQEGARIRITAQILQRDQDIIKVLDPRGT